MPGQDVVYLGFFRARAALDFFAAGFVPGLPPPPKIRSQPDANCFVDPVWTV
jgi:hypothetical protein